MTIFSQTETLAAGVNTITLGGANNPAFPPAPNWLQVTKDDGSTAIKLWVRVDGQPAAEAGNNSVPSYGGQQLSEIPLNRTATRLQLIGDSPNHPSGPYGLQISVWAEAAAVATFEVR